MYVRQQKKRNIPNIKWCVCVCVCVCVCERERERWFFSKRRTRVRCQRCQTSMQPSVRLTPTLFPTPTPQPLSLPPTSLCPSFIVLGQGWTTAGVGLVVCVTVGVVLFHDVTELCKAVPSRNADRLPYNPLSTRTSVKGNNSLYMLNRPTYAQP